MTTVVSLANMPSSTTDVAIAFLNQALLKRRSTVASGSQITTEYVYAAGDPNTETVVTVTSEAKPNANTVRLSWNLRTVQTVTVDSIVTETAPINMTVSMVIPGRSEDTAKVLAMVGTLFGLTFNGVTSKIPNTGIIDALNRGITDSLYS